MKKTALVTGAARRLGAMIVRNLANAGYKVAIHHNRSAQAAFELVTEINDRFGGKSAVAFQSDFSDLTSLRKLPQTVYDTFGRFDLLVNNASIFEKIPVDQVTGSDIDRFHNTHVKAPAILSIESAKWLELSNPGHIVNIVDIYAYFPKQGYLPYTISKSGLKALTGQLAIDLAPDVLVNAVAPGAILEPETYGDERASAIIEKIPLKKFGEPADIANAVLFLAESDYITGHTIVVDGGRSLKI